MYTFTSEFKVVLYDTKCISDGSHYIHIRRHEIDYPCSALSLVDITDYLDNTELLAMLYPGAIPPLNIAEYYYKTGVFKEDNANCFWINRLGTSYSSY